VENGTLQVKERKKPGPPKGVRYGGRARGTPNRSHAEIREIIRSYGPELVGRLIGVIRGADKELAFRALQYAFDRGYGRPAQEVQLANPDGSAIDFGGLEEKQLDHVIHRLELVVDNKDADQHVAIAGRGAA
jgi:hypothetical protein